MSDLDPDPMSVRPTLLFASVDMPRVVRERWSEDVRRAAEKDGAGEKACAAEDQYK